MRTITAIVITAVFLLSLAGGGEAALTDNSVATVQDLKQSVSEIDSPNPTEAVVSDSSEVQPQQSGGTVANTQPVSPQAISRQEALTIAFTHARVTEKAVSDLETDLDWEQGVRVWEVDFEQGGFEYEYDIDAAIGKILRSHKERDD